MPGTTPNGKQAVALMEQLKRNQQIIDIRGECRLPDRTFQGGEDYSPPV